MEKQLARWILNVGGGFRRFTTRLLNASRRIDPHTSPPSVETMETCAIK